MLVTLGCGSGGELCEVGGSSPVDFRHRVCVVPQCGRSAAAMAKTSRGVTQVEPRREQLARRVVPQPFDIQLDAGAAARLLALCVAQSGFHGLAPIGSFENT